MAMPADSEPVDNLIQGQIPHKSYPEQYSPSVSLARFAQIHFFPPTFLPLGLKTLLPLTLRPWQAVLKQTQEPRGGQGHLGTLCKHPWDVQECNRDPRSSSSPARAFLPAGTRP